MKLIKLKILNRIKLFMYSNSSLRLSTNYVLAMRHYLKVGNSVAREGLGKIREY